MAIFITQTWVSEYDDDDLMDGGGSWQRTTTVCWAVQYLVLYVAVPLLWKLHVSIVEADRANLQQLLFLAKRILWNPAPSS